MDVVRARLINRIDELLTEVIAQDTPSNAVLQLEASIVVPQHPLIADRRVILETIDVDHFRQHISSRNSTSGSSTPYPITGFPSSNAPTGAITEVVPHEPRSVITSYQIDHALNTETFTHEHFKPTLPPSLPRSYLYPDSSSSNATPPNSVENISKYGLDSGLADKLTTIKNRRQSKEIVSRGESSAVDKLIEGIWEQLHSPKVSMFDDQFADSIKWILEQMPEHVNHLAAMGNNFAETTRFCHEITASSRLARSLEVLIQAHWIACYNARLAILRSERSDLKQQEQKKTVLLEACGAFGWSEKELRNRMAIWKGYQEIKQAAGWTALVFAGPGIYRFCKYRQGFDDESMQRLRALKLRTELAADTLHPQWRQLLALVGEPTDVKWVGHPHDWTVSLAPDEEPLPLGVTYKQWDPDFSFKHLEESVIDVEKWGGSDPRRFEDGPVHYCKSCTLQQSNRAEENACECYPDIYSPHDRRPCPVQIFRTAEGKNNGLIACRTFEVGQAIGEFLGLITKGLADVDVMQSQAGNNEPFQIWQGRCGNFTRFINHSCASNCSFQTFSWLGIQRIVVVVSKGVSAGTELTVDYSDHYWANLDKICLCGEPSCRYKDRLVDKT